MTEYLILYNIYMEEGTSPNESQGGTIGNQNSWETPPSVFPANVTSSLPPIPPQPVNAPQQAGQATLKSDQVFRNKGGFFSRFFGRKIVKIGILIFIIISIILIIVALILPRSNKSASEDVTLTYWGLWEDENVMRPVLAEFEKENPKIKIDYKKQDPVDYRERLSVRVENGTGPDIFRYHNTWYPMLSGILLPLPKETIENEEFENNYYDTAKKDLIKNGTIYGIPLEIDTLALYVNKQVFDDASREKGSAIPIPKTWQEFIESSNDLTKRDEEGRITMAGAAIGTLENVEHAPDIISLLLVQNGVDLDSLSEYTTQIEDALRFYTNFALVENNVWDQTQDNSMLAFSQGKVGMYFGYSWDYFSIKAQNPNIAIDVAPVPQLISTDKVNIASYWAEGISANSKHPNEAFLFMKFLAKKETQEKLFTQQSKVRLYGEPYSNKNLADKLKNSVAFTFVDQAKTAVSTPFVDGTNDNGLNDKLNAYLKDAVNAILSGSSGESVNETFIQGFNQVLGQFNEPTGN